MSVVSKMKISTYYTCEICGYSSDDKEEVFACELQGFPTPVFIPDNFDFNKEVPLYGKNSNGVAKVVGVRIENTMGCSGAHSWILELDREILLGDCDWEYNGRHAECFDHYLHPENNS
jgi:hypothetical protein